MKFWLSILCIVGGILAPFIVYSQNPSVPLYVVFYPVLQRLVFLFFVFIGLSLLAHLLEKKAAVGQVETPPIPVPAAASASKPAPVVVPAATQTVAPTAVKEEIPALSLKPTRPEIWAFAKAYPELKGTFRYKQDFDGRLFDVTVTEANTKRERYHVVVNGKSWHFQGSNRTKRFVEIIKELQATRATMHLVKSA